MMFPCVVLLAVVCLARMCAGGVQADALPNVLLIVTDEERAVPSYTPDEVKEWLANLPGKRALRAGGSTAFTSHRTASTACSPSRASLYTGHLPHVHGVTQTYGLAKEANDPEMSWLQAGDVPNMGAYFEAVGYDTVYIGKWHLSHVDLVDEEGFVEERADAYARADMLRAFGWHQWIGPEPHGASFGNSGFARDPAFVAQFLEFLRKRTEKNETRPWVVALNLVNPHDIVWPDFIWRAMRQAPLFDETVPESPDPPSLHEDLTSKPSTQRAYVRTMRQVMQGPLSWSDFRKFYLYLTKLVDAHIHTVLQALHTSPFGNTTIVAATSDHGDMLGAHGGMIQKWHQAYEETLNIPLIIRDPRVPSQPPTLDFPTSSIDLIPTLLGLVGADVSAVQAQLRHTHTEVHDLPGRDLSPFLGGADPPAAAMTYHQMDDQITRGARQEGLAVRLNPLSALMGNWGYDSVEGPPCIEAVISQSGNRTFKLVHYHDDPSYWTQPGVRDVRIVQTGVFKLPYVTRFGSAVVKTRPLADEWEMYDLAADPAELTNLAHSVAHKTEFNDMVAALRAARSAAHRNRHAPLPPPAVRNARLPAHVNERTVVPLGLLVLTSLPVVLTYGGTAGALGVLSWWVTRRGADHAKAD